MDHVSSEVKKDKPLLFVWATGSGKSSIINVFMRFYEFQSGASLLMDKIYVDSHLTNCVLILFVLQEPFLYHGTIASNIQMYQDISQDDIIEAARFVDAAPFIEKIT